MDLLERDDGLADLNGWLGDAVQGRGCVVLVGAEAGLGKTTLVRTFTDRQSTARVLWGACDALFTPRPLAPVLDVARQVGGALLETVRSKAERDELFSAALDEFEGSPTVAVFEDLHWADDATLDFLKFVGRRIARTRTMLLATFRDDEVRPGHPLYQVLADLPRASTHRLTLSPLSERAVTQLARRAGRSGGDVHRVTGGNPLFVTEVLASSDASVPGTIRDAVLARAARLSPGARRVVEIASVVPAAVEEWLVESLVAPTAADLDGCLELGMTRRRDGRLAFRHELVRRALEDSIPPAQRRALHAAVLSTLVERGDASPARLTHHAAGAEDAAAVLTYARVAGVQAAALGAHREAAAHYATALRNADRLEARERAELHEGLAFEYYLTDRIEAALDERRAALEIWRATGDALREGDTLRWLSRLSWFAGRRADADRFGAAAVAALETLPAGRELALAYSNQAQLEMLAYRTDPCVGWATRAIELAERLGDREVLSHALNNRGAVLAVDGLAEGRADLERSLELALADDLQEHAARAYTNLVATAVTRRRYDDAARAADAGMAYCDQRDLDSWRYYIQAWRARARFERGEWLAAGDDLDAIATTSPVTRLSASIVLAHLRARRGDPDVATPLAEARRLAANAAEIQRTAPLVVASADIARLEDRLDSVVDDLRAAYALAGAQRNGWIVGDVGIWLWRAGALDALPESAPEPYRHEAAGRWREAAAAWARIGCPYERACMLGWYGDDDARREALAEFERLGAAPAAQQLRRAMRASGVRGIPRGSRASTRSNSFGLTRREAQILALMREGLRNSAIAKKLYLSTRTVDHHVSAVLAKLGAETRAQAVAIAARTDGSDLTAPD